MTDGPLTRTRKDTLMSYNAVVEMAGNQSLLSRVVAAAAGESIDSPLSWAQSNIWQIVSAPGWADSWDSAKSSYNINQNPDTGARNDVITDSAILAEVQAIKPAPAA